MGEFKVFLLEDYAMISSFEKRSFMISFFDGAIVEPVRSLVEPEVNVTTK